MRLTPNFTLAELCHSQTADRLMLDNIPTGEILANLVDTAKGLESVRSLVQHPIFISSGYRSNAVNKAVGGSKTSQHMTGQAADITVPSFGSPHQLMAAIVNSSIKYDQCILEFADRSNPSKGWVHISFKDSPRKQALIIDRAGTRMYA